MTGLYEACAAGVLVSWCLYRLLHLVLPKLPAVAVSVVAGFVPFIIFPELLFYSMIIAIFAPFGLLLPMAAVQGFFRDFGYPVNRFATVDLVIVLILYLIFVSASVGVVTWDPYRYGYDPVWGGFVALILCLYGMLREHLGIVIIALAGQFLWMLGIGSSNFFDHVSHVLIIPVILVCLFQRALSRVAKRGKTESSTLSRQY